MRVNPTICLVTWLGLGTFPAVGWAGTLLEMSIRPDALYTPGDLRLDVTVTPAAKLAGPYRLRILACIACDVVHERTMAFTKGHRVSCELPFPEMRILTEVRCRVELFVGEELIEACEKVVRLWPRRGLDTVTPSQAESWVFDPSGVVPNLFSEFGLAPTNATFQAVRDFGTLGVVFVGEKLDPCHLRTILDRVGRTDEDTVVVLLRQECFPKELQISMARDKDPCDSVTWERAAALLQDLAARDLMGLLQGAQAVHIKKRPGRSITSYVTGMTQDQDEVCSYLCLVREQNRRVLFCQLPSTDPQDPRQMVLLRNLIQFACERLPSVAPPKATDTERAKP